MRDRLLAKIRTHMESRSEAPPCTPDICQDAYCRNGDWCTLYNMPLSRLNTEDCELGVYGETLSFPDVLREVGLALSVRKGKGEFEYECSLLYNACLHALSGQGQYTLILQENHCKACAHRMNGWCDELNFSPADCDTCGCYTPAHHEHHFDPFCF